MKPKLIAVACAHFVISVISVLSQSTGPNYDEAKVPAYTLPEPLVCKDGTRIKDSKTWSKKRRPELLRLFEDQVYGRAPKPKRRKIRYKVTAVATNALNGLATRKEISIFLTGSSVGPRLELLLYLPNNSPKPVPAFLGLNFNGNHAVTYEPDVRLSDRWMVAGRSKCIVDNRATEECRGIEASRWPAEKVIARGYALATAYYGDLEPDFTEGWKLGLRAALSPAGTNTIFKPDEWGAIGAWAWGLSRALDYLETEPAVNAKRVAVIGHSRLGKTSLWAGARDERFAIVISNESGEGGAALARRQFGERTADLNRRFPHWFCGNFKEYSGREDEMPVDQHELITLIAPRPVYVASAQQDRWADPRGEFLAAKNAEPVYALFGKAGLGVTEMPSTNRPVGQTIGYHMRSGPHDVTEFDWEQYLNFADRHFKH